MSLLENVSPTVIAVAAVIGIVLLLWFLASLKSKGSGRDSAQVIAAVQAERDVLRANHAVEIATLEGKLADAQGRLQTEMEASLKLREAEQKLSAVETQAQAAEEELVTARGKIGAIAGELEELRRRTADLPRLEGERERASQERDRQSEAITELRGQLQETMNKLSKATAERQSHNEAMERLRQERDEAVSGITRQVEVADGLRRDVQSMGERLAAAQTSEAGAAAMAQEVATLREREETLSRTVRERDEALQELRAKLSSAAAPAVSDAEVAALKSAAEEAGAREAAANESLSRLAYDRDGLTSRLEAAERVEREAKAEVEKREALLELRLQKIYELEGRLRDQHAQIHGALRRAEMAEELASARGDEEGEGTTVVIDSAAEERAAVLDAELAALRADHQTLSAEADELRVALNEARTAEGDEALVKSLAAAEIQIAELKGEVRRLRTSPPPSVGDKDVAVLKAAIRELADRFVVQSEAAEPSSPEPSLADKIRAFKAAREAEARRPLRIAAPADPKAAPPA